MRISSLNNLQDIPTSQFEIQPKKVYRIFLASFGFYRFPVKVICFTFFGFFICLVSKKSMECWLCDLIFCRLRWSTSMLDGFTWMLNHVIYFKLRKEENKCYVKLSKFTKSQLFSLKMTFLFIQGQFWVTNLLSLLPSQLQINGVI